MPRRGCGHCGCCANAASRQNGRDGGRGVHRLVLASWRGAWYHGPDMRRHPKAVPLNSSQRALAQLPRPCKLRPLCALSAVSQCRSSSSLVGPQSARGGVEGAALKRPPLLLPCGCQAAVVSLHRGVVWRSSCKRSHLPLPRHEQQRDGEGAGGAEEAA